MLNKQTIAVNSDSKLARILNTVTAVLSTLRLSIYLLKEFFNNAAQEYIEKIVSKEEFASYAQSEEFCMLGVRKPLSKVIKRIVTKLMQSKTNSCAITPRFALFACHNLTIASMLVLLGVIKELN
jgi:hypothetical protein